LFPPFPFSNLFSLFLILSNAKVSKNKYAVEKEESKWWIWGERENLNQMVEERWKRKWDNYQFTSRRELHVYSPRARLSPYL
jgi:hypothetical protein